MAQINEAVLRKHSSQGVNNCLKEVILANAKALEEYF